MIVAKSSYALLKSKGDRRRMLKLRGVTVHLFPDGDWKMALGEERVDGVSRSATVGRLRMCSGHASAIAVLYMKSPQTVSSGNG